VPHPKTLLSATGITRQFPSLLPTSILDYRPGKPLINRHIDDNGAASYPTKATAIQHFLQQEEGRQDPRWKVGRSPLEEEGCEYLDLSAVWFWLGWIMDVWVVDLDTLLVEKRMGDTLEMLSLDELEHVKEMDWN
jgi:hypothetical protein